MLDLYMGEVELNHDFEYWGHFAAESPQEALELLVGHFIENKDEMVLRLVPFRVWKVNPPKKKGHTWTTGFWGTERDFAYCADCRQWGVVKGAWCEVCALKHCVVEL